LAGRIGELMIALPCFQASMVTDEFVSSLLPLAGPPFS
jgi:hypothetical protein